MCEENKSKIIQNTPSNHILTKKDIEELKEKESLTTNEKEILNKILKLKEKYEEDKIKYIAYNKNKNQVIEKAKSSGHLTQKLLNNDYNSENTIIIRV